MKIIINLTLLFLLSTLGAYAQTEIEVSGVVKDQNNETLIGVYVSVKDRPGVGTVTDLDGRYKIKSDQYGTLIFSYIGFDRQEVQIAKRLVVDVILKPSDKNVLKEVIVTGTGTQQKATITGAITTVDLNTLRPPAGNITNALAGNVAGIIAMQTSGEPGKNASEFWIRGMSTFGGGASALVLVDGFERPFNEINIEDIESFSVLKDASATAIYGSKGANGVIIITTKKGVAGKININAKAEYGYMTRTRTPEFVGGYDYAQLANEALITRNLEPRYTSTELDIFKYGLDPDLYPNVDWQDVMLRDGASIYRATLDLSGGGSTVRYFASGSFIDEGGMYKADQALKDYNTNANMSRWNYRVNLDFDITKTTLVKIGVSGFLEKQNTPGLSQNIWPSLIGQSPVSIPVMYSNGLIPAYGIDYQTNPWVLATQTGYNEFWKNKAETNVTLEQNLDFITNGLKFLARAAYDTENLNNINRIKWPEQYSVERKRDRDGNLVMKRISEEALMHQESSSFGQRVFVMEADLTYSRIFKEHHRVGGLVRYNQRELVETSNIGDDIMRGISRRNLGISGRATYALYDRYMAEFNFGYTGSENFKKGNQFGFFPAISFAWNISEESFIKRNISWLNLFKIRYSYGEVGNDAVKRGGDDIRFPYLSSIGEISGYNFGDFSSLNQYTGLHYTQVASEYLSWEIAKKHNLGFDINVLNNRLSLTVDFFKDNREKIYKEREYLPSMAGITSKPWANVGKMESKGFDGQIKFIQKVADVEFTMRGNITYARNEVLEYDEQANSLPYTMTQGYRWQQARGLISQGLFKDYEDIRNSPKQTFGEYLPGDIKYKDVNGDGVIDQYDIVPIGATRIPNLVYGMALALQWKGLDFNIHFQGSGKSSYFIGDVSVYPFSGGAWGNVLKDVANPNDRWISREISGDPSTERTDAKYPRLSYGGNSNNYRESSFWLRDGSYIRLKTLEIGYTMPQSITSMAHISRARVYFLGNNLAIWDSLKLWDPELGSGDGMKYPPSKTLTVGLTVSF